MTGTQKFMGAQNYLGAMTQARHCVTLRWPLFPCGGDPSGFWSNTWFLRPTRVQTPHGISISSRFIRFCSAHSHGQQTHRQTDHATCVAIGRISSSASRCRLITSTCWASLPRISTWRCPHCCRARVPAPAVISAAGVRAQQQTNRMPLVLPIAGTDSRTDGHPTLHRPCSTCRQCQ